MSFTQPAAHFIELSGGDIDCRVSVQGGAIVDAYYRNVPFVRPFTGTSASSLDILDVACFPLVPFGGRIENNTFEFDGNVYRLEPNTGIDRHYLHGDAWLAQWAISSVMPDSVHLSLQHSPINGSPYHYTVEQQISVHADALEIRLDVRNTGDIALPFGLGFHPFFPLTERTTLCAQAGAFWSEKYDFLPGKLGGVPAEFDFNLPATVPDRWINNGFEQWNGVAEINWHDRNLKLSITTEPALGYYQLFQPGSHAAVDQNDRFFCFEPMSHCCNGHNLTGNHGLVRLAPGDSHCIAMTMIASIIE